MSNIIEMSVNSYALKVVLALLKVKGEVSEEEIRAIPSLSDKDADLIISTLIENLDVEVVNEKKSERSYLEWHKIIRLKSPIL